MQQRQTAPVLAPAAPAPAPAQIVSADQMLELQQLRLQILKLTQQVEMLAQEKAALEVTVSKQKVAIEIGGAKMDEMFEDNAALLTRVNETQELNESLSRSLNESREHSFSASPSRAAPNAARQENQQANRDKHSSEALRQRKGTCPKVVEENQGLIAGVAISVAGAYVAYKKFF